MFYLFIIEKTSMFCSRFFPCSNFIFCCWSSLWSSLYWLPLCFKNTVLEYVFFDFIAKDDVEKGNYSLWKQHNFCIWTFNLSHWLQLFSSIWLLLIERDCILMKSDIKTREQKRPRFIISIIKNIHEQKKKWN